MADTRLSLQRVAVVGAGVSGISAAIHLKRAGLDVTVFERTSKAGGIWVYDERRSRNPTFPSILPSTGDSPEYTKTQNNAPSPQDTPLRNDLEPPAESPFFEEADDISLSFAPPGPCYIALQNNVSTIEMELSCHEWKPNTPEFVPHHVLADYLHDTAAANGILENIAFNTRVVDLHKTGTHWEIEKAAFDIAARTAVHTKELFDGVVIASGHYHACNVPDIKGLAAWNKAFPIQVFHSKLYRRPESFQGQNVLLIGAGVSSTDIAKDLGPFAKSIYQSSRGGPYDLPSHILPENAARVGGIQSFDRLSSSFNLSDGEAIPGTVTLKSGEVLCNIHHVIVATGYHVSFPFLKHLHADGVRPEDASHDVLVTNGQQTHNLHKDIFYIPDPTLSFIGVPYHVATFTAFEFQGMAVASVFSGNVPLPSQDGMRREYNERIERKGAGREFHSLKAPGDEIAYVQDLVDMVNASSTGTRMKGHTKEWLDAYARRDVRRKALFSQVRDPVIDERVMSLRGC